MGVEWEYPAFSHVDCLVMNYDLFKCCVGTTIRSFVPEVSYLTCLKKIYV
jgi:hypothetical protein